ncbi:MAG: MogA/MoaB family molybdenum cofactor biosynthesis protein [Deltaproteobacteria bacterium]|nr:MogA/MoaB family molybdenum cofactor biosynthesis protein [Deltaproteobacteria bacterium]
MAIRAGVITVSDKGSRGEREDVSGREIIAMLKDIDAVVDAAAIIPDEPDRIKETLIAYADGKKLDLILTTGGTGVSPRDLTPDATLAVIDKEVPGMAEAMRRQSAAITPHAMISRAVAGIRGQSLIINLPGSPKGVRENLSVVLPALQHAIEKIKGDDRDCAPQDGGTGLAL